MGLFIHPAREPACEMNGLMGEVGSEGKGRAGNGEAGSQVAADFAGIPVAAVSAAT